MNKPENFISNSDFATLKNDDNDMVQLTIPASVSVTSGNSYTVSGDLTIGLIGAEQRIRIQSSILGSKYYPGFILNNRTGTSGGFPTPYAVFAITSRINSSTVRCFATVPNLSGSTLTGAGTAETFTFKVNTLISPNN